MTLVFSRYLNVLSCEYIFKISDKLVRRVSASATDFRNVFCVPTFLIVLLSSEFRLEAASIIHLAAVAIPALYPRPYLSCKNTSSGCYFSCIFIFAEELVWIILLRQLGAIGCDICLY